MNKQQLPHVIIIGGGFGGLYAARALGRAPVRLTVIDRRNHHCFQPLLYQVATAALSPADIAMPIRGVLRRQRNTQVVMAEVVDVDTERRRVVLADGTQLRYDYLILATGATHHYFGNEQWAPLAPGLKTIEDAVLIRRRFLLAFEAAEQEPDEATRRALLTFVVVGAGPTGVEMAGAMAEVARYSLLRDFRHIDPATARIILVEGLDRVLPGYAEESSAAAAESLRKLGVEVRTGAMVTRVDPEGVHIGEDCIPTRHVVWAAGVAASGLGAKLGVPTDKVGRVPVEPDCSIPGHPEVFVIGDLASFAHQPQEGGGDGAENGKAEPLPGVAQVALQQGKAVAANLRRELAGKPREPFRYRDKGTMAVVGRAKAVAEIGRWKFSGFLAWLLWLLVHLLFLVGFRNRLLVMIQWAYLYLTWQRGARLITGEVGTDLAPSGEPLGSPEHGEEPIPSTVHPVEAPASAGGEEGG